MGLLRTRNMAILRHFAGPADVFRKHQTGNSSPGGTHRSSPSLTMNNSEKQMVHTGDGSLHMEDRLLHARVCVYCENY
jgi:hypothetical protein